MIGERLELLQMEFRCDPAAPAAVRGSMSSLRGLGWALGDAMLVASELVTSLLRYTGCERDEWMRVHVDREPGAILISVEDPGFLSRRRSGGLETDELGLLVVDRLTRRWGTQRDNSYRVWAEVPVHAED